MKKLNLPALAYRRSGGDIKINKMKAQNYNKKCTRGIFKIKEGEMMGGNTKKIFKIR